MGIPEQKPQNGMNIAPDGTIYEILEDGTIKRIGKVSSNGEFEPFGGPKDGVRVKDGIIYRVINGKEQKIGRILPNGEIETINQRIRNEAEVARNKVKIVTIVSVCCLIALIAILYSFNSQQQAKVKTAEINARIRQEELAAQERRAEEEWQVEKAKLLQTKTELETKRTEAEAKKAEEKRKQKEAEAKIAERKYLPASEAQKAEPKNEWSMTQPSKATMSEEDAKVLYMEANAMKDENPEEAKKTLQKIINSVDPSSKHYKKAKELLERL